jgi:hypothetical protein
LRDLDNGHDLSAGRLTVGQFLSLACRRGQTAPRAEDLRALLEYRAPVY